MKRILIVEDEQNIREFEVINLKRVGYETVEAGSGEEALEIFDNDTEGFQIALLNMHIGDRWVVYIPYELGYGKRTSGPIPAFSTLVFEIELISIA